MKSSSGHTLSWWADAPLDFAAPMLRDNTTADVCIVGGGIAGLTTAYLLGRENIHVVLLDSGSLVSGETARTTAHLSNAIDDRYYNLERWHGPEGARLAGESHTAAIELIERISQEEMIDCDFKRLDGFLFGAENDSRSLLADELKAAHRAGLTDVAFATAPEGVKMGESQCLRFPRQGQFNPLLYLHGLIGAIESQEARIFGDSRVVDIEEGSEVVVTTENGYNVRAKAVVVATNSPINNRVSLHTKMAPYRTYVIAARIPAGSVPLGLYWDNLDPYHYVRLAESNGQLDTLIIGGEDHKTGQESHTDAHFTALEHWARLRFPQITGVTHRWSGQVMETIDGLAFAGRNPGSPDNCYVITGDSGMGMTHGTLSAKLVTDLIQKRSNRWESVYKPDRVTLTAGLTFAKENLNVARQYLDWARPNSPDDVADLPADHGRVVQRGLEKLAIYRAPDGTVHEMSAVCPHLGCVVHWNDTERTWDCPCHGSRFDATGDVLNGPASAPLSPHASPAKT